MTAREKLWVEREPQVREAIRMRAEGAKVKTIAAHFGVAQPTIVYWTAPGYIEQRSARMAARAVPARFWAKVDKDGPTPIERPDLGPCWRWTDSLSQHGYGRFYVDSARHNYPPHRYAYELLIAPVPKGLVIDHLCRNHACVNPAHLEPVTDAVNVLRGVGPSAVNAVKTHCIHGHEFTPENTYVYRTKHGGGNNLARLCLECNRRRAREYQRRRKAALRAERAAA